MAAASEQMSAAELESHLRQRVKEFIPAVGNPWCRICRAPQVTWRYEVGATKFQTLEEALPHLRAEQAKQAATLAMIDERRRQARNN